MKNALILGIVVIFLVGAIPSIQAAQYRQDFQITNQDSTRTLNQGYSMNITIDHASMLTLGSLFNGTDVKLFWGNTSTTRIQLTTVNVSPFRMSNTTLMFSLPVSIPASTTDRNFSLEFGNISRFPNLNNGTLVAGLGSIAYWVFESGTQLMDITGVHNGTLAITWTTADGRRGRAYQFSPATNLSVQNPTSLLTPGRFQNFSVEAWIYIDSLAAQRTIISHYDLSGGEGWFFSVNTTGNLIYSYQKGSGTNLTSASETELSTGQWYHVAFTYNGTLLANDIRFFVDGIDAGTLPIGEDIDDSISPGLNPMIGAIDDGSGHSLLQFSGRIDDLKVYRDAPFQPLGYINPEATIASSGQLAYGINLAVREGRNNTETIEYGIRLSNTTHSVYINDLQGDYIIGSDEMPNGEVNLTFFKAGYLNASFGTAFNSSNKTLLQNFSFFSLIGLANIIFPLNNSLIIGGQTNLNITTPEFMNGTVNLSYNLDGEINITLCTDCREFFGAINIPSETGDIRVHSTSTIYGLTLDIITIQWQFGTFNLTIYDEISEDILNISSNADVLSATVTTFCSDSTNRTTLTHPITPFNVSCEPTEIRLTLNWTTGSFYRTLIPTFTIGELRFYMVDVIHNESNVQTVFIDDVTGLYGDGEAHLEKILRDGSHFMIDQNLGPAGQVFFHIIIDEQYIFSVTATGQPTRIVGGFPGTSDATITIRISDLPLIPPDEFQLRNVGWSILGNATTSSIRLLYNDTLNQTTSLTFNIYNATTRALLHTTSVSPTTGVQVITFTISDVNSSYIGEFIAIHSTFGTIKDSATISFLHRIIDLVGVPEVWYQIIGLSFVVFLSLIFGSFHSSIGVFAVALGADMVYFLGFIDQVVGFGVIIFVNGVAGITLIANRRNL